MPPKLSVITICFNNPEELQATCRSVEAQSVHPFEHLVIDGSPNKTILNWLENAPQPSWRRWIHERDNGISDAFNKGVSHAAGDLTHLLNSGDMYFQTDAIEKVLGAFESDESLMWLHSRYIQHRGEIDVISGLQFEESKAWKGMRTVAHPTMFIKKELYRRHGLYNENYKIAMDYDMLVRIRKEKFRFLAEPLVYFAPGGASNKQFERGLTEVREIHESHIGFSLRLILWQWRQRLLRLFMRTSLGRSWFGWKNSRDKASPA